MLERDKVRYIYKKRVKELGKRGWREERKILFDRV